jgi:hypothetical protein
MPESIDFPRNLPEPGNVDRVKGVGQQPNESEKRKFTQLLEKEKEGKKEEKEKEEPSPPPVKRDEKTEPTGQSTSTNGRGKFIDVTV